MAFETSEETITVQQEEKQVETEMDKTTKPEINGAVDTPCSNGNETVKEEREEEEAVNGGIDNSTESNENEPGETAKEDKVDEDKEIENEASESKAENTAENFETEIKVEGELKRKKNSEEKHADEPQEKVSKSENACLDKEANLDLCIIQQLEYYFGDINLHYDKFLRSQISDNKDGWVTLRTLMTFKRLLSICNKEERIAEALARNTKSSILQLNDEKTMVRRNPDHPLPEYNPNRRQEIRKRTAYAKGFPQSMDLNLLVDFFSQFEGFEHVDMRKYYDRPTCTWKFKGSVFVIFKSVEHCKDFLAQNALYDGKELKKMWQQLYIDEKQQEFKKKAESPSNGQPFAEYMIDNEKKKKEAEEKIADGSLRLAKGAVVKLIFEEECTRDEIRNAVSKVSDLRLAFVEYTAGAKEGFLRFIEENAGQTFMQTLESNTLILDTNKVAKVELLKDEKESEYLIKTAMAIMSSKDRCKRMRNLHAVRKGVRKGRRNDVKKSKRAAAEQYSST